MFLLLASRSLGVLSNLLLLFVFIFFDFGSSTLFEPMQSVPADSYFLQGSSLVD